MVRQAAAGPFGASGHHEKRVPGQAQQTCRKQCQFFWRHFFSRPVHLSFKPLHTADVQRSVTPSAVVMVRRLQSRFHNADAAQRDDKVGNKINAKMVGISPPLSSDNFVNAIASPALPKETLPGPARRRWAGKLASWPSKVAKVWHRGKNCPMVGDGARLLL